MLAARAGEVGARLVRVHWSPHCWKPQTECRAVLGPIRARQTGAACTQLSTPTIPMTPTPPDFYRSEAILQHVQHPLTFYDPRAVDPSGASSTFSRTTAPSTTPAPGIWWAARATCSCGRWRCATFHTRLRTRRTCTTRWRSCATCTATPRPAATPGSATEMAGAPRSPMRPTTAMGWPSCCSPVRMRCSLASARRVTRCTKPLR